MSLQALVDDGKLEMLQEMYNSWPFFSVTLDMMEMVFAKQIRVWHSSMRWPWWTSPSGPLVMIFASKHFGR